MSLMCSNNRLPREKRGEKEGERAREKERGRKRGKGRKKKSWLCLTILTLLCVVRLFWRCHALLDLLELLCAVRPFWCCYALLDHFGVVMRC